MSQLYIGIADKDKEAMKLILDHGCNMEPEADGEDELVLYDETDEGGPAYIPFKIIEKSEGEVVNRSAISMDNNEKSHRLLLPKCPPFSYTFQNDWACQGYSGVYFRDTHVRVMSTDEGDLLIPAEPADELEEGLDRVKKYKALKAEFDLYLIMRR